MAIDWRHLVWLWFREDGHWVTGLPERPFLFSMASFRHIRRLLLAKYTKAADEAEMMARAHEI